MKKSAMSEIGKLIMGIYDLLLNMKVLLKFQFLKGSQSSIIVERNSMLK